MDAELTAKQGEELLAYSPLENDFYVRQVSLNQACHDDKGQAPIEDTIDRARKYFDYLKNG